MERDKNEHYDSPRDGITLFEDTLADRSSNSIALGNVLAAIYAGALSIHGQLPDKDYPVAEYLTHGGRVKFDLSDLSGEEQDSFFNFITNGVAIKRPYATHRFSDKLVADGSHQEIKTSFLGAVSDFLASNAVHFGVNLAIGGRFKPCQEGCEESIGKMPKEDGCWGHLYIHRDPAYKAILVGVEGANPDKKNVRTNQEHNIVGLRGALSAFYEPKSTSKALHEEQRKQGKTPINIDTDINWATVRVTPRSLGILLSGAIQALDIVRSPHPLSEEAAEDRLGAMRAWEKKSGPIREEVTQLYNTLKETFNPARMFGPDKNQYILPLARLSTALFKYAALLNSLDITADSMQEKYHAVMSSLEAMKCSAMTNDTNKMRIINEFSDAFKQLYYLDARRLRERQLPDVLQKEIEDKNGSEFDGISVIAKEEQQLGLVNM